MSEKRVTVWVQAFKDRANLMLQWIDPDTGRRRSKSAETSDPDKAEQKRADKEYELNHGLDAEPSRLTWECFRELFEDEYLSGTRKNTREGYGDTFDLVERLCRPPKLAAVNERVVSAFVAAMRKEPTRGRAGMMASTIKVRLQHLRTALRWAAEQKLLPVCPKFPSVKVPEKTPQPIPAESFERILDKAPATEMRAYLLCGWLAGLRLSEAYMLEWEETDAAPYLDLARDRIILPAEIVKAVKDQWVPLDPALKAELLALPRHGKKVFRFISRRTGRPLASEGVSDRVAALAKRAGVRLTMHALRKGFGRRYAGKVPAQVLQKLMRHRNIKTTMDYYANVDAAVEEAVFGPPCNSSRNSQSAAPAAPSAADDATSCDGEASLRS